MQKNISKLINAYVDAYDMAYKKKYTEPKIYNANGDLKKRWYVYFSFRNPTTDKLERQTPIYLGVNKFTKLSERTQAIKILRESVSRILADGINPFTDNDNITEVKKLNIKESVKFVLKLRKNSLKESSYKDFESRIKQLEKWLLNNGFTNRYITSVNKVAITNYLNEIQLKTSSSNRNNTRGCLGMFFKTLEDNEIIKLNFIPTIPILKTTPERNKTYTLKQEKDIFDYLQINDKELLLFIKFISFNFLRPVEVCRLKIKDINIEEKRIYLKAKNKAVKIKIIPEILIKDLPDLTKLNPEGFLFTPIGFGHIIETTENNRRDYFSKRFLKVKNHFNLSADYGLYSFRHTFITKLYNQFAKQSTPNEAKSRLMLITGHNSMLALEKYLRDIDAVLPQDYSDQIS